MEKQKKITDKIAAFSVRFLTRLFPKITPNVCKKNAKLAGSLIYEYFPIRYSEIKKNIELSNLNLSSQRVDSVIRKIFEYQFMNLIEFMRINTLTEKNINNRVKFLGLSHFDESLSKGKGVILLTAHFGNWEYLGASLSIKGYPLHSMVRFQTGNFDEEINKLRKLSGNKIFGRNRSARKVLKILKNNGIVGLLSDQHSDNMGYEVDFLGRKCMATGSPVAFSLKSGAPIVPAMIIREDFEKFRVEILPPIGLEITGNKERDIHDGTQKYTTIIENFIKRYPEQWFWFHKRWRN